MNPDLIPHLFRSEFRKISSVLGKHFGSEHLQAAEDITSETFLLALETWPYKGIPDNPTAWLYTVAKNKARNYLIRSQLFDDKIAPSFRASAPKSVNFDIDLSEQNIADSQLQMLFAICHPAIPTEAQIGLALRILCGFGIEEIASAFLTQKEIINKRLFRAKEKLRQGKIKIEFPGSAEIDSRLETVLKTLYLLFNEGYYSETNNSIIREDLCLEAMRLAILLIENEHTNLPEVNALLALMCFQSSRFPTRRDKQGELILYQDQDESRWNHEMIAKGVHYLQLASGGTKLSRYHLEASIAYWHTHKQDTQEKWEMILSLYNKLLIIEYSPIAALNRTYALAKANGKAEAIREAEKLALTDNPYYFALLGELYKGSDNIKSKQNFQRAFELAKTQPDKHAMAKKLKNVTDDELQTKLYSSNT